MNIKVIGILGAVWALICLALMGGLVYALIHFIQKVW